MTREEAKESRFYLEYDKTVGGLIASNKAFCKGIDKIYDYFLNTSCQNCKYGVYGVDSNGVEVECTINWDCSRSRRDRYIEK